MTLSSSGRCTWALLSPFPTACLSRSCVTLGELGVGAVARRRAAVVEAARTGTLSPDALSGGTFTITNLGAYDIDGFTPIINPPQAAILGMGRIVEKPAVFEGQICVRSDDDAQFVF